MSLYCADGQRGEFEAGKGTPCLLCGRSAFWHWILRPTTPTRKDEEKR